MGDRVKSTLSFGFTKRTEAKKLQSSAIKDNDYDKKEETDYLVSLEDNEIKSVKPVVEKGPLVIPLIQHNRWLNARKPEDLENDDGDNRDTPASKVVAVGQTGDKVTDAAVREILSESAQGRSATADNNLTIPLLMKNKVPDGFETDDRLDVSLRPNEATEEDYEKVPIEQFGLALLRGMGWKEGDGVGRTQRVVNPLVPVVRPKGLGLGADKSVLLQSSVNNKHKHSSNSAQEDELVLKRGSFCVMVGGKHDGQYGTVVGIDEDNARVMVSLAVGSTTATVSQFAIKLITKSEFDKFSKYLNKGKVDRYKEKHEKGERLESNSSRVINGENERSKRGINQCSESESEGEDKTKHHRHRKHKKTHSEEKHTGQKEHRHKHSDSKSNSHRDEERQPASDADRHHSSSKHKHLDRNDKRKCSDTDLPQRKWKHDPSDDGERLQSDLLSSHVWLRSNLRVRIVDENYGRGKYYKTKVTVVDVISAECCICRTDDGQVLDNLNQSQLETVIPRDNATHVMIVSGKHRAQLAQLLNKDKTQCQATVQLLSDRDVALTLPFDAICEYAADVSTDSFDY